MIQYEIISQNGGLTDKVYVDSYIPVSIGDKIYVNGKTFKVVDMEKYLSINIIMLKVKL